LDVYTGFLFSIRFDDRPLLVRAREKIADEAETAVVLGEAPDGLPLVLRIARRCHVEGAVMSALGVGSREELSSSVDRALQALEAAVRADARKIGIEEMDVGRVYRSGATVGSLLGPTLLARTIGSHSPLILEEDRYLPSSQPEQMANTAAVALSPKPVTVMKGLNTVRHLALPLRSGPIFTVELDSEEEHARIETLQPLLFENLRALRSARFHCRDDAFAVDGDLADEHAYERAVRRAESIGWSVSRHDLGRALADLSRNLQAFHDEHRVHCDVKTGNALITAAGAAPIDPLGVPVGEVSPGATPGWASPEQLLARPVSPESDVYSLGLMAALLVNAAIYGEERSFVIPTGGGERHRVRLLGSPDVFIDPSTSAMDEAACRAWAEFIRHCVAFEPEQRPENAAAFAAELESLLEQYELPDRLPVPGGPGQLSRSVEVLGGLKPSWVIEDRR